MHLNYLPKSFSMKLAMRQDWWGNNLICGCCCCCEWNEEGPSLQLQEVSLQHTSLFLGRHTHKWDERKYSSVKAKHSGNKWARDKNDWRFCGTHHDTSSLSLTQATNDIKETKNASFISFFVVPSTYLFLLWEGEAKFLIGHSGCTFLLHDQGFISVKSSSSSNPSGIDYLVPPIYST